MPPCLTMVAYVQVQRIHLRYHYSVGVCTSRAVHLRGRVHRRMLHSAVVYTNEWTSACLCIAVPMDTHTHVRVTKPVRVGGARGAQ